MKLTYCIDPAGIGSWLSLAPTKKLVEETGIEIDIVPMTRSLGNVAADSARTDDPLAEYKARRARARNKFAEEELQRDCLRLGIHIDVGRQKFDGTPGAMGLIAMTNRSPAALFDYLEAWYTQVYKHQIDASAVADALVSERDTRDLVPDEFNKVMDSLLDRGLFSAPSYLLDLGGDEEERFHGRQHLPLIRWMINGSKGHPPL